MNIREHLRLSLSDVQRTLNWVRTFSRIAVLYDLLVFILLHAFVRKVRLLFCFFFCLFMLCFKLEVRGNVMFTSRVA